MRTVPTMGASVLGRSSASRNVKATGTGPSRERKEASSLRSNGEVAGRGGTASSSFRHNSRKIGGNASPKRRQSSQAGCNFPPAQALHLFGRKFLRIGVAGADLSACGNRTRAVFKTAREFCDYAAPVAVVMVSNPCASGPVSRRRSSRAKNNARKPRMEKIHIPRA